ncbi:MAG: hypothetical protein A3C02_04815 [Candidatus Andersenbacteria bacterium RIFCSPHIGHO2_02_FULL_45_11]|uniref:Uncharacterized protein n=1 Tax=Candidatus Andersenbacteria bacterium RIFCSPHIGHO2_12_FULL_45_11 TaxID=1797281 RepID=A0A1G1X2Q0_9BACT|nr:MAG: hypothetical protein A2805_00905 [Candidatus Andersenbacteria bacterium RIFCSPHIGHO2_01_FULL_46_36]OGY31931.1 MAG: hypothetical protein A3C02_04815 [Candidatus Andersenbacteria bacterium RIFCSPHIGHO2_02_FULL_45_11]OGY33637.1 MAG: hypothetical protein A3D99_03760 [Candidatus Andersenbacteria bacterium RIFCSPHIGHO2_12_FULL_45_11]
MIIDPMVFTTVGDVFLNLSAGWFGAAVIIPAIQPRGVKSNIRYRLFDILFGFIALVIGYKFRILGL